MSDHFLIPFGDRFLALDPETFQAALAEGDRLCPPRSRPEPVIGGATLSKLLTAGEMAARTSVPASWFLKAARAGEIPFIRFQKYVRFDPAAVEASLALPDSESSKAPKVLPAPRLTGHATKNVTNRSGQGRAAVGARNGS